MTLTDGEAVALEGLLAMVTVGFDRDRFAQLLNLGPGAVSDAVWARLCKEERGRKQRVIEERENLAIVMLEVDLARRLVIARRGSDPRIPDSVAALRTAAFHAMEKGAALNAAEPEAVLWFQAASVFFEKTGETLFQADALAALAGCLYDTLHGDMAANLVQADEILTFARSRSLSAFRRDGQDLPLSDAALERLAWIALRRALIAVRQSRFIGADPQRVLNLLVEACAFAAPLEQVGELHEEIRGLALAQAMLPQIEPALAAVGPQAIGDEEQLLQRDLLQALAAERLRPEAFQSLVERIGRRLSSAEPGALSPTDLHLLRAQLAIAHHPSPDAAARSLAALPDLDMALAVIDQETRRGRNVGLAARRVRATARARVGRHEAALDDLAELVVETERAVGDARTSAGARGSAEQLRSLGAFAVRIGVLHGHAERGLAIADACRAVGLRAQRSGRTDANAAKPDFAGFVPGMPNGTAAVSLIPTEEGTIVFVTLPGHRTYRDGATMGLIAEATESAIETLSIRWGTAYRTMLAALAARRVLDPALWSRTSDVLSAVLHDLARLVVGPLARMLERAGVGADASLSLIPHGGLAQFPLHAAGWLTSAGWACPLDRYAVSYAPSLSYLALAHARKTGADVVGPVLGVFDPTQDLGSSIAAEREALTAALGAMPHRFLDGANATLAAFRALAPGSALIHFAGHGTFDPQIPGNSGLHLADAVLDIDSIAANLDLTSCHMIFLSACETSMSDGTNLPDEFVGLPGAFLGAGCDSVVGAGWAVPSDFAAIFSSHFYAALAEGETRIDHALRQAMRRTRDAGTSAGEPFRRIEDPAEGEERDAVARMDSPLTWASFALYGLPWRMLPPCFPPVSAVRRWF